MKVSRLTFFLLIIFVTSCSKEGVDYEEFDFSLIGTIRLENEIFSIHNIEFKNFNDSLIYGYDILKAVVFKFDSHGNLLKSNRFQNGENEIDLSYIGHLLPVNEDSIFVLESGFGNLLLLDKDLEIRNSWNILKLTGGNVSIAGSRNQIINFQILDSDPYITLTASNKNYFSSQKDYFENTFLAAKINLNSGEYKPLFKYPNESPYRENLFWGNEVPYFLLHKNEFFVTFPLDPNIYIFSEESEDYRVIPYSGKLNKEAVGVKFGMYQDEFLSNHYLEVFHNKNDFYLASKNMFLTEDQTFFIRVGRKALNSGNFNYKDLNTFNISGPKHEYIIQFVDLNQQIEYKWKEFILPEEYINFIHIDQNGNLYFNRENQDEEYSIDVLTWSFNDLSKL